MLASVERREIAGLPPGASAWPTGRADLRAFRRSGSSAADPNGPPFLPRADLGAKAASLHSAQDRARPGWTPAFAHIELHFRGNGCGVVAFGAFRALRSDPSR